MSVLKEIDATRDSLVQLDEELRKLFTMISPIMALQDLPIVDECKDGMLENTSHVLYEICKIKEIINDMKKYVINEGNKIQL